MDLNKLKIKKEKDLKWPKILISILSTIGIVDTGSITLKNWGLFNSLSCPGNSNGCDAVLNSPWGSLFKNNQINIPLSLGGFISYSAILLITLLLILNIFSNKQNAKRILWWFIYLISCGASVFSILLINIMLFRIEDYCIFCILSAILSFSIFILSIIGAKFESRETMFYRSLIVIFVVLTGGLIWSNKVDPANADLGVNSSEGTPPIVKNYSSNEKIRFAKFLNKNQIVMYSAYWCPHCHDQKELFGKEAVEELTIIECAKDGKDNQFDLCQAKGIEGFPSWEINNNIYSGTRELSELGELTNYPFLEDIK
tara:strand:+ start:44 stop:982 length:939 start_codon:yes stop_codon:yes gene_type:complete